jgi:glucose-6-phosphate isomerase
VRVFAIDRLDEEVTGALLMHWMVEILVLAEMMGVNPYDQPAVEEGKQLTRDILEQTRKVSA